MVLPRKRKYEDDDCSSYSNKKLHIETSDASTSKMYRTPYKKRYSKSYNYKPKLVYPRNTYASSGKYRSRAPYRMLSRGAPELKYFDISLPPVPFSYGDQTTATSPTPKPIKYIAFGTTVDPYQVFDTVNGNDASFMLGGNPTGTNYQTGFFFQGGLFSNLASGTGPQQRIGNKVYAKSLYLTCNVRNPFALGITGVPEGNQAPVTFRILCVMDKQPNGTLIPKASDILQAIPHISSLYAQPNSPNNLDNRDRFKTLFDIKDTLSPQGVEARVYEKYQKLNCSITYSGVIPNPTTNDIYILFVSDGYTGNVLNQAGQPVAVDNRPYVKLNCRIRYTDS